MSVSSTSIEIIDSIAAVGSAKAAWLVDIWGVMHNGVSPFSQAVAACQTFRRAGGCVVLLSNAPRPEASVAEQLDRIGVARDAYDAIVSSGDASLKMIGDLGDVNVFHLGPDRDLSLYAGFQGRRTSPEAAQAIVCTGLFDDETETPDDYRELLSALALRDLEMICANPDLKVERGGKLVYCAGALAKAYEELGAKVRYAGKPHLPIYRMALSTIGKQLGREVLAKDVLAIGDGVHTDIEGAARAGIEAVFVASRVHVSETGLSAQELVSLFATQDFTAPIAAMSELVW